MFWRDARRSPGRFSSHEARCNRSIQCTPMREDMRLQLQSSSHPNIRIMREARDHPLPPHSLTNIEHCSPNRTIASINS